MVDAAVTLAARRHDGFHMLSFGRQCRSIRRTWQRMARRRLRPAVGARLILRSVAKAVKACVRVSLVFCALAVIGVVMVLARSVQMARRPRQVARGLAGRFSWNRISPDR